jgi:serine O-acetyltransferase
MTAPLSRGRPAEIFENLGSVTAALRNLRVRSHQARYGGGPPPPLPSRTALDTIVESLRAALFPRHFGPPDLSMDSLDAFVSVSLSTSVQALQRQVRLELNLHDPQPARAAEQDGAAFEIASAFLDDLPEIRRLLETDIRAAYEGDPAAISLDQVICSYPGVAALVRHRLAHRLHRLGAPMLGRVISEGAHSQTGIDIHPGARIGESFFIDHGTGVVIGETAEIGDRVRLYQGVTLGARRFETDQNGALTKTYPRHPIIEDDVVIYAGASVLGRITVGRGSVIAGNVWLTDSVPANSRITQAKARAQGLFDGGGG